MDPLDIAIYHAVDESIKELLIPVAQGQPLKITQRRPGMKSEHVTCDVCFFVSSLVSVENQDTWVLNKPANTDPENSRLRLTCDDFNICFKCQSSKGMLHADHEFSQLRPEFDSEVEE
jgi:hypothetical protein